jgi:D-inositol-3-phosphate glycosyltransferase
MNVYVRELVSALAQAGVTSDVYTRRWADHLPDVVEVEPGFRVVHVPAGPVGLPKEALPEVVDEFTDWVLDHLVTSDDLMGVDALHANYWLSGVAGHRL